MSIVDSLMRQRWRLGPPDRFDAVARQRSWIMPTTGSVLCSVTPVSISYRLLLLLGAGIVSIWPGPSLAQSVPPTPHAEWVCPNGGWGGSGPRPACGGGPAPRPPSVYRPNPGPSASDAEAARYNEIWSQAQAAFAAKNYALALQLYEQAVALNPGPAGKGNIEFVKGLMAWNSDPRSALAFFQNRRRYLDQYDAPESAQLRAGNANYIAQLESIIAAQDQAARDQADLSAAAGRAAAEINQARADADHAAALAAQRESNEIAAADRQVAAFEAGANPTPGFAQVKASAGGLMAATDEPSSPSPRIISRDGRTYQVSGNGMIGGTVWITGFNVQNANPAMVKKADLMMAEQMRLAGMSYADGVDFQRYNFVLGIAASTNTVVDLATRVVFDEYKNGQYTAQNQAAYDSLKGRQFDELGCHSNGAMICLAALENHDIVANKVVLYGPQITVESLKMWDELVREHKVASVQIYANSGDPVPPLSLAIGGGSIGSYLVTSFALLHAASFADVIHRTAPDLALTTFTCASRPDLSCHDAELYKTNVQRAACLAHPPPRSSTTVPGTALLGRPETAYAEPPPPC